MRYTLLFSIFLGAMISSWASAPLDLRAPTAQNKLISEKAYQQLCDFVNKKKYGFGVLIGENLIEIAPRFFDAASLKRLYIISNKIHRYPDWHGVKKIPKDPQEGFYCFLGNTLDFLFVGDGVEKFSSCLGDWYQRVMPGGVIAGVIDRTYPAQISKQYQVHQNGTLWWIYKS